MDNREVIQKINEINKKSESKLLTQVLGTLILVFFVGIPDDLYKKIFEFHLSGKDYRNNSKISRTEIKKYENSITELNLLFQKISDDKIRLIIGTLVSSIGFNRLQEFRNTIVHINKYIENYDFKIETSSTGHTLH